MSSVALLDPAQLDTIAAQVIAGVESSARAEEAQPFFAEIMEQVEVQPVPARRYTGAQFFLRYPEKFRAVVHYLAHEEMGVQRIAEMVGCSQHTVQAVRDHFPQSVATDKRRIAALCRKVAEQQLEAMAENPQLVPWAGKAMTAGIALDKAAMLDGGPALTIEHRHTFSHEDYNKLVAAAPIDVDAQVLRMGNEAGKTEQMRGAPAADLAPAGTVGEAGATGGTDSGSLLFQSKGVPATGDATTETGGEGVAPRDGGVAKDDPI